MLDEWQSACTHCGICSDSCITFQATGWEHQSPRGRIRLARDFLDGKIEPGSTALQTFDQCLGCHACEVRCPLDVPYAKIRNSVQELRSQLAPQNRKWGLFVNRIRSWLWKLAQPIFFFRKFKLQKTYPKKIRLNLGSLHGAFNHDCIDEAVAFINRLGYFVEPVFKLKRPQEKRGYFLDQGRACSMKEENNLYAWFLNELADSRLVMPVACEVYYQPYCGQKEKGVDDPIWQLLNRIENLFIQKLPFPLSCCGGYGGKAVSHSAEAQQWGNVKLKDLPKNSVIIVTSPDCWNQCKAYEEKNFQVLYPFQLLSRAHSTIPK